MKMAAFWDLALCSLVVDRRFRGAYCLYHQDDDSLQFALLKRQSISMRLHSAISQKAVLFTFAAVRTGKPNCNVLVAQKVQRCWKLCNRLKPHSAQSFVPETGYTDWGVSWFHSVSPGECRDSTSKLGHDRFLPNTFQLILHLSTLSFGAI
jgi:hypothetical protein